MRIIKGFYFVLVILFASVWCVQVSYANDCSLHKKFYDKIRQSIENKDSYFISSRIRSELLSGPRRSFIENKPFDDVFPEEWQNGILNDAPACKPTGDLYMLGHGQLWYEVEAGQIYIISLNGVNEESRSSVTIGKWFVNEKPIHPNCFTYVWMSGDNYKENYERYLKRDAKWNDERFQYFLTHIGEFLGINIPLYGEVSETNLVRDVSICSKPDPDDYFNNQSYKVLKFLSLEDCNRLAPNVDMNCSQAALVDVLGPDEGSMGARSNVGIYAVFQSKDSRYFVAPLVNFDNKNLGWNFVDELEKSRQ